MCALGMCYVIPDDNRKTNQLFSSLELGDLATRIFSLKQATKREKLINKLFLINIIKLWIIIEILTWYIMKQINQSMNHFEKWEEMGFIS